MAHDLGRGIGEQRLVAGNGAREDIVDHHGRDGGDEASRGREQGLRDARRHDGEIAGVALRDRDETVHDAPDRAEEADERRRRADGRQQAGAAHHGAPGARLATRERGRDALLDALGRQAGGSAKLGCRRIEELREPCPPGGGRSYSALEARGREQGCEAAPRGALRHHELEGLASHTVQVTSDAKTRPSMTSFTTIGVEKHPPRGKVMRQARQPSLLGSAGRRSGDAGHRGGGDGEPMTPAA